MSIRQRETVSSGEARRRVLKRRSLDEKRRIVEETLEAGASVSVVARRRGALGDQKTQAALVPVGVIGKEGSFL